MKGFAVTIPIGSGSGSISQTSMSGIVSGDTLAIVPGTYVNMTFTNLTGIVIINGSGLVTITGTMTIGSLTNCTITGSFPGGQYYSGTLYGIVFTGTSSTSAICNGGIQNCWFRYWFFNHTNQEGFDFNNNRASWVYTGTTASLYSYQTHFDHIAGIGMGGFYQGTFADPLTFTGTSDSTYFTFLRLDSLQTDGDVFTSNAIFDIVAHDDSITNSGLQWVGDRGVWDIVGNGDFYNIYRNGYFGYLIRIQGHVLNGRGSTINSPGTTHFYNNFDCCTIDYGSIDYRISVADTSSNTTVPYIKGSSMYIWNLTSMNKYEALGFTATPLVLYDYGPVSTYGANGYVCEMKNILAGLTAVQSGTNHWWSQETADPITDTANLQYFANPVTSNVFQDTVSWQLKSGSPAINAGTTLTYFNKDHLNVSRPQSTAWDTGWQEYIFSQIINALICNCVIKQGP